MGVGGSLAFIIPSLPRAGCGDAQTERAFLWASPGLAGLQKLVLSDFPLLKLRSAPPDPLPRPRGPLRRLRPPEPFPSLA